MSKKNIRFNLKKHDQKVESRELEDARQTVVATMDKISRAYQQLAGRLTMKRKKGCPQSGTGVSVDDLKKFMADLEAMVERECAARELQDFKRFTISLIREKGEMFRLQQWESDGEGGVRPSRNVFIPVTVMKSLNEAMAHELPAAMQPAQVRYTFREQGEFEALPEVRMVVMAGGYVGLVLEENRVLAVFEDGSFRVIGMVANGLGLSKVPSRAQYVKALKEKK